jgi:GNAT superfamily N-acetyltransferase
VTPDVLLRDYAAADASAVLALITAALEEHAFSPDMGGLRNDLASAHETYHPPKGGFWVAERNGVVIGTAAVRPKDAKTAELKRLYVRADARGLGLGQILYAHAESFARAAGYDKLWLDSSRRFAKARRLYEKNGFLLLEELQNDWEDNVYEKSLR